MICCSDLGRYEMCSAYITLVQENTRKYKKIRVHDEWKN